MTAIRQLRRTYAEYLALERETDMRHEFLNGEAWMMAGGTPEHSTVKTNLTGIVMNLLRGTQCRPYDSDLKVRVVATGLTTYPDLTVVCGAIDRHPDDPNAIVNPMVLFEVLSKSTESWDRGAKFMHYQAIPTLREYVLVSVDMRRVEVYLRADGGVWTYTAFAAGDDVRLGSLGVAVAVDALYEGLPIPTE